MLEFLHQHTNVIAQPPYNSKYFSGINPYALGFAMFCDIRRICEQPTDEDRLWFPEIAGSNWLDTLHFAAKNFKDESFISQFLSPKLIRDMKLFSICDNSKINYLDVTAIHDDKGYLAIRETLSNQYNLANLEPNIEVYDVQIDGDRSLTLRYCPQNEVPLNKSAEQVLKHLYRLWGFEVRLEQENQDGSIDLISSCPTAKVS